MPWSLYNTAALRETISMIRRPVVSHTPQLAAILVGLFLSVTAMNAQLPKRDQPPKPREGTGVIRGRVTRADTGEPLRRAQVRMEEWTSDNPMGPAATMTDAEGRYELTQLPAGRYQLKASRGGYVEVAYGQRRPFERGRPLELGEGAVLQNIDFALPPGGLVTGRVVDEAGEAVASVSVSLSRQRYIDGARRLVDQSGHSTDDRGEFRIFGVPPGEYVIVAKFHETDLGSRDRIRYVPTYYPGTPLASAAQRVTVGVGQEVPGILIALIRATTATIRGVVRGLGDASAGPFTFVSAREIGGPEAFGHAAMALGLADGSFTIAGLLPGTYLVEARSMAGSELASTEVVVDGSDVGGVTLLLSKGATARGRIHFDTGDPPKKLSPSQVFVTATFVDQPMGGMSGDLPPVTRENWTFELTGLRGRGFIRAGAMSDWHMKRVRLEGVDVTDTILDFTADISGLEIELTERVSTVSGGVSDDRGDVARDATVVVFADDAEKWGRHSRFIMSARPDQHGRFTIKGLPPGRYVAIAVGYLEPGEEQDPDLLKAWRQRGTPFTLSEGETHTVDLKLSAS
jgi:hypothetical protein